MLDLAILFLMAFSLYGAYRHGFLFESLLTGGMVVSFIFAVLVYRFLIPLVYLWVPYPSAGPDSKFVFFNSDIGINLDDAFYAGISFLIVFALVYLIFRIFARSYNFLIYQELDYNQNALNAMTILFGFINFSAFMALVMLLIAMIPIDGLQTAIKNSIFGRFFANYMPFFSLFYQNLFIS